MKKRLLIALAIMLSVHHAKSQFVSWEKTGGSFLYDFSGARGTFPVFIENSDLLFRDTSTTAKPGWLPAPTSGSAILHIGVGSGTAPNNGRFDLDLISNPKNLKVRIPWGGPTKFTLIDIENASEITRFSTMVNFGSVTTIKDKSLMRMAIGNRAMSSNSVFTNTGNLGNNTLNPDVFAALGFEYNATTRKVTLKVRRANPVGTYIDVKTSYFDLNTNYLVEIIGNNSGTAQKYNYGANTNIELASQTFHIYINGTQIDNGGNYSFPGAAASGTTPELAVNNVINAAGVWFLSGNVVEQNPTFTINNLRFDYAQSTLPVSLTSFTAQKQNNWVKLNWSTASEQRNSHFDVLRSSNGKEFHSIVEVAGAGNSTEMRQYSHTDYNPFSGTNYYKLKQVDLDGTATESDVRAVTVSLEKDEFIIYQEGNGLMASVYSGTAENGTLRVSDISGKVLIEKDVTLQAGYTNVSLGNKILTPGVYVAHIIGSGKSKSVKFLHGQ